MLALFPLLPLLVMIAPAHAAPARAPAAAPAPAAPTVTLADVFPVAPLTSAEAAALLVPATIGPPARTYDQTTVTPGFARAEESAIEAAAVGATLPPASDGLRRYTRQVLSLMRKGVTQDRVEWFLAEHMGLATAPRVMGTFFTPTLDPAAVGTLVAGFVEKDPELRSVAVAVERDDAHGGWVGILTGIYGAAEFEPFPRVHTPGAVAVLPGTLLASDTKYAVYVSYPGTEVREFPLAGKGDFDVEVALPQQPGVYRVAMNTQKKRQLPDSAFFFTLYVGQEPLTTFPAAPSASAVTTGTVEQDFLAEVNAARGTYQLPPLVWVDRTTDLRAALAGLPPADREMARWRHVQQIAAKDPLPGQLHGAWGPAFTDGQDAAEAAWTALEHPISRATLLGASSTMMTAGALPSPNPGGVSVLSFVVEPGSAPLASRDAAHKELRRLSGGVASVTGALTGGASAPGSAVLVQSKLDAVAAEVASGKKSMKQGLAAATKVVKELETAGWIGGAMTWSIYTVPPGQTPKLESLGIPATAKNFSVGAANGNLGMHNGSELTVLVVLAAASMK
ncbi:MAG: hypothetical protein V4850_24405 [Myxococcota bacterium]